MIEALHENSLYEMNGRVFEGRFHSGRYPCNIIVGIERPDGSNKVIVNSIRQDDNKHFRTMPWKE